MLVLLWVELIFFAVAGTGLCFGFILEAVLINTDGFATAEQRLHRVMAFPASHTTPAVGRLGVNNTLGGDTAGTGDPS